MPRVSVVIPSYNHARFVRWTIQSILNQSYSDWECVITDDGSSDESAAIIAAIRDPRIKFYHFPQNRGACVALNHCIRHAVGDYIAVLNSDDLFLPDKLRLQVDFLDDHPEIGAVFGYPLFIDENNKPLKPEETFLGHRFRIGNPDQVGLLRLFFAQGNFLCHPTVLIRRECYERVGLYDERLAALPDFDMWIRLIRHYPIHILQDAPLIAFRIFTDKSNASHGQRPDAIIRAQWEMTHVLRHYLHLPSPLFDQIFAQEIAQEGAQEPNFSKQAPHVARSLLLGRIAASVNNTKLGNHKALNRLGLELLFEALPPQMDVSHSISGATHQDLIKLTGSLDVYGTASR